MNTITQDVLDLHRQWLRGEPDGVRLDRRNAYLSRANLEPIKADLWAILDSAPAEVPALRLALVESRVDGTTYSGPCACLVGTIANVRGVNHNDLGGITPDADRPAERWFLAINETMSAKHPIVALTIQWIDEWTAAQAAPSVPKEGQP